MPPIMANSKDGQGHKDRYLDTSGKILSQEMLRCNMKSLALTVQKLLARLKFSKNGSNSRVKVKGLLKGNTRLKYQSSSTHYSKFINKVKVFKEYLCEISKF